MWFLLRKYVQYKEQGDQTWAGERQAVFQGCHGWNSSGRIFPCHVQFQLGGGKADIAHVSGFVNTSCYHSCARKSAPSRTLPVALLIGCIQPRSQFSAGMFCSEGCYVTHSLRRGVTVPLHRRFLF